MIPVIAIVLVVAACDALIVWAVLRSVGQTWRRYADRWPPSTPAADAVTRRFQSFSFGLVNAGWGLHASVDEEHLHLVPTRFMRWCGCTPVSIPWTDVAPAGSARGRRRTVRLADGSRLTGPAWCLALADTGS